MCKRLVGRLTYANVVATLALFIALGGGAYAALTVTGKHVKNRSLTGRDIRPESLTGAHVKRLTTKDFKRGRVLAGSATVVQQTATVQADGTGLAAPECPPRTQVTGGGFAAGNTDAKVLDSRPAGNGWIVFLSEGQVGVQFQAFAVCAP